MTMRRHIVPVCTAVLSLGCYKYAPVELDAVPLGTRVRAVLTTEGQIALRIRAGLYRESLNGTLLQRGSDSLLLGVRWLGPQTDLGAQTRVDRRIHVARREVARLDRRELDKARTGALIGTVVVGATVGAVLALEGGEPGSPQPPPGEPPESVRGFLLRIPLLAQLRLPR